MNWIEVAWTTMGAASLTLGLVHLTVWFKQRTQFAYLIFFVLATAVAGFAVLEMLLMRAQSVAEYAAMARWAAVPLFLIVLSLVGFVHMHFGTGRAWLGFAVVGLRLVVLAANFATDGVSVNFREITGLAQIALSDGAVVAAPIGIPSAWNSIAQASNLLLLAFVADATLTLWRRRDPAARRRALLIGGSILVCIAATAVLAALIVAGSVRAPTILTASFFVVVVAMGYDLANGVAHAAQLSRELRESEQRTELARDAAGLAFWSWNTDSGEIWIGARGRALFEFSEAERIHLDDLMRRIHPDDREAVREGLREAARAHRGFEHEFRLALPSGRARRVATRGRGGDATSGFAVQLYGVAVDVTERRRAEREAEQQRNELAHLSRVATLGELSGSLAHEINQPLMGILSNAQAAQRFLAGDSANLEELREILADIVEDDKRAGEVIRRLRVLLKKGEVQYESLDVNGVVADVLRLVRNELMNRDITVAARLASDLRAVSGDRIQLQQVLLNLIMNACDAMEGVDGSRRIVIATRAADGGGVELSVGDEGRGIPPDDLLRIFDPFVTTKEQGMGLGLSVCNTIVSAHGGSLWAENNPTRGATFRLTLPKEGRAK